jgi:tetratricopeptide (TPR) repeat protein
VRRAVVACVCVLSAAAACTTERRDMRPMTLPDLSRVDPGVQAQVRERYETLKRSMATSTPAAELATSYGQYGMVLHAAEFLDVAEPCYLNAQALAPDDVRWPYYLANLYKSRGETDKAEGAFKRALALQPDDLATLIWLGRLNLDQGKTDAAEPLFAKAYSLAPRTVAVVAGLGRVAVAKRDYAAAVKYLEEALAMDPDADSLHAPLATAYRGLGQIDKAQPHIGQWRNRDLPVPDPRQQDMDLLLESGLSYELRGVKAFEGRDWKSAVEFFRKGVALAHDNTPLSRSLHHKLGTAFFLSGDLPGAQEQFEAVVRQAPSGGIDEATAKAHYSLGLIADQKGQRPLAVEHLAAAVKYQPNYVEAHLAYADELRRVNSFALALAQYDEAAKINPRSVPARLGYAVTLVALGRSRDALDWLTSATMLYPDRLEYKGALARLLAASPDDRVRDAKQALAIIDRDFRQQKTTEVGETIAMALADLGDFEQAVGIQRGVMTAADSAGMKPAVARMAANLRLYQQRQPCRHPWPNDLPVVLAEASP